MATRPISKLKGIVDPNRCLWLLFVLMTSLGVSLRPAYAQNCAQCATNAVLDTPVSTGEWLLTKQVNEVNVLFMAARKGKPVSDVIDTSSSVNSRFRFEQAAAGDFSSFKTLAMPREATSLRGESMSRTLRSLAGFRVILITM